MQIEHTDGTISIEEIGSDQRQITVALNDPREFSPRLEWTTRYQPELIEAFLKVRGPGYLCDEIARDEDPTYLQKDLETQTFAYLDRDQFTGRTVLDFGCGCAASTMILARLFPDARFIGVELESVHVELAKQRSGHYGLTNAEFLLSPDSSSLPSQIDQVDFVFLNAVFEHLLPDERPLLLKQMWDRLADGGILLINQTPDLRFPIETHTTGLPFLNYLPDALALRCARRFSSRIGPEQTWEYLLRSGIRGSTPSRILRLLADSPGKPELMRPLRGMGRRQSDLWYRAAKQRMAQRYGGFKKLIAMSMINFIPAVGIPVAPYLTLAIKKHGEG